MTAEIRSMAEEHGPVSAAKVAILNIEAIKTVLGNRWEKLEPLVGAFFEAAIQSSFKPGDAYFKTGDLGYIVIACGGGGIPVLRDAQGDLQGLEAVIDKDFASSLLARDLGAELFVVSTGVEKVAVDFGKPAQRWLERVTLAEVRKYLAEGQFPKGSMGPKIEAIISFLEGGGTRALITNPPNLGRALSGATGTHIVPA